MSLYQNPNQFNQTTVVGAQDQTVNNNIKMVRINPAYVVSTLPLVAGQQFKLVDVAGEVPVVEPAAVTDQSYGVAIHNMKTDTFLPGQYIELACDGSVIFLETNAAVARGARVQMDPTGPTVGPLTTTFGTNCQIGIMLDKPTATGKLARVQITPKDANESAY